MKTFIGIVACLAIAATPARAIPLPKPEDVTQPAERPQLARFISVFGAAEPGDAVAELDAILGELPQPTQLRGLVQFFRASALRIDKPAQASEAVLESVRLLPGYSAPLLLASQIFMYQDQSGSAADYVLRASRIDPSIVNLLDDYEMAGLMTRLSEVNDKRRLALVGERLLETGWTRGRSGTISRMAMAVIEERLSKGDVKGASALVPRIVSPASFRRLLGEKSFAPIRLIAEDWAGQRLEKQWPIYLEQTRAEWEASRSAEAALAYVRALQAAGHDRTMVAAFLPIFDQPIDPDTKDADDLIFIVAPLADALARLGRWNEVDRLFQKASAIWPAGSFANALNVSGNRARLQIYRGNFEEAVKQLNAALDEANKWGGQVNQGASATLHLYRACAFEQLGRATEGASSAAIVISRGRVDPSALANFHLCRNDVAGARQALLEGLKNGQTRSEVVNWLQPVDGRTFDSGFARELHDRASRLRNDPALLGEARKYATIFDWPMNAAAPTEGALPE
ncbi:MAG TPA: tetratricopeptide repeat protein [Allosphingosinicella sp.]|uniref:tetratricopeptide repeat protein n=1 Tax=Allosphingosinicella sp. TaxID=2823234 RepID=UPI002ED8EBD0